MGRYRGSMGKGAIAGKLFLHIFSEDRRNNEKAEKQREIEEKRALLKQTRMNRK